MTDRELLELAAKAAGVEYTEHEGRMYVQRSVIHKREWNPLTDDGDALRLAVTLGLAVSVEYNFGSTAAIWGPPTGHLREQHGDDPYAATRRAIVRASAELGKEKP